MVGIDARAVIPFVVNGAPPAWVHLPRRGVGIPDAELHIVTPVLKLGEGANYFPNDVDHTFSSTPARPTNHIASWRNCAPAGSLDAAPRAPAGGRPSDSDSVIARELRTLRRRSYVVNARAEVLDQRAALAELANDHLAGPGPRCLRFGPPDMTFPTSRA